MLSRYGCHLKNHRAADRFKNKPKYTIKTTTAQFQHNTWQNHSDSSTGLHNVSHLFNRIIITLSHVSYTDNWVKGLLKQVLYEMFPKYFGLLVFKAGTKKGFF